MALLSRGAVVVETERVSRQVTSFLFSVSLVICPRSAEPLGQWCLGHSTASPRHGHCTVFLWYYPKVEKTGSQVDFLHCFQEKTQKETVQ